MTAGQTRSLAVPGSRMRRFVGLRHLFLDLQRVVLLLVNVVALFTTPLLRRLLRLGPGRVSIGVRLRRFCERMGITYLKLGQFLAMRFDVLPPDVCHALEDLFDAVAPLPLPQVLRRIEHELGRPIEQLFSKFDREPLAAASVAQVHRAWTREGEAVVVKVQRPGIEQIFRADVRNVRRMAGLADWLRLLGRTSAVEMVDEFTSYTLREMHFVTEGRTAERLRRNAVSYEYIPRVYWNLTSQRVLTLEFVEGVSVSKVTSWDTQGRDDLLDEYFGPGGLTEATSNFSHASMRQLFVTGFFHGDPHPGNILFTRDRSVVFLDFGIFGALTPDEMETLASFVENEALGNIDNALHYYEKISDLSPYTDKAAFRREVKLILAQWHHASKDPESPIAERHFGVVMGRMLDVSRRHHVKVRAELLLFFRALLTLNASALRMAHKFDVLHEMEAFFRAARPDVQQRIEAVVRDPVRNFYVRDFVRRLPEAASRVRDGIAGAPFRIAVEPADEPGERRESAAIDAIGLALVAVALVIAATSVPIGTPLRWLLWCTGVLALAPAALMRRQP